MSEYVIRSKSGMHLVSTEQDTGRKEMVFETKEQAEKVLEVVLRVFKNEEFEIVTTDRLRTERKETDEYFLGNENQQKSGTIDSGTPVPR